MSKGNNGSRRSDGFVEAQFLAGRRPRGRRRSDGGFSELRRGHR